MCGELGRQLRGPAGPGRSPVVRRSRKRLSESPFRKRFLVNSRHANDWLTAGSIGRTWVSRRATASGGAAREAERGPHVTLEAVARTAGVSPATASRALNGTARVRDDLRSRVLAAADRLGYIPNAHAQALASSSNNAVGVICHDVGDPCFAAIASGVMAAAASAGRSSCRRAPSASRGARSLTCRCCAPSGPAPCCSSAPASRTAPGSGSWRPS
ncbi:LacI family DNA-binding transcriptional regulator [Streptomyces atriruber]|uniref:LacI family DNA-binding transcriptional regulator n=1 Tax=Streptomyces atriruber TaxID=545121 RepID=UPI003133CF39